jgi:hypothetical protein
MTLQHANNLVAQFLHDAGAAEYPHLVDAADVFSDEPSDIEIVDALVEVFDLTHCEMIDRLMGLDFNALRREVTA